ncbi:MAG: NAD(P)-dependent oxidoreductase [Candidatus Saganbacteria bacterium]|nr:NAD(P)-dependent oxidoreductase [Candidatus Saganbacteria bacterium]
MKILITGASGLLGKALIEQSGKNDQIIATYLGNFDIPSTSHIKYVVSDVMDIASYTRLFQEFKLDVVIHAASIGSPDFAEKNREKTWEINVGGTKNICQLCEKFGVKLIHISSNGIYDGEHAPYAEDDIAKPVNYYGETKLESEKVAKTSKTTHSIVRPILMYGWPNSFERGNIVTFALSKLAKGEIINVYDDVFSNPLFVGSCAKVIWKIIYSNKYDTYNVAGSEIVSIYDLIKKAAEIFDLNQRLIKPVKQGFFNELVKRPKDTSYKTDKMQEQLSINPMRLEEGLTFMKQSRCS